MKRLQLDGYGASDTRSSLRHDNKPARWWAVAGFLVGILGTAQAAGAVPHLSTDAEVATAGYFQLKWGVDESSSDDLDQPPQFQLQTARAKDFADARVLYQGKDTATVLSGLSDGNYFFRVRAVAENVGSGWSEPVEVVVEHHSLTKAFAFFAAGAVVFLATVAVAVFSSRKPD